jgi:BAAT / Acyl-CoA thioester hydrolase C terminal
MNSRRTLLLLMALAYFRAPGLPRELKDIPLEYFARALRRLRSRPDVDPNRVAVIGISRGGEAALLIGATYPRLVHGVVALVPSNVVNPSPDGRSTSWTLNGRAVPQVRPEEFGDPDPTSTPDAVIPAERITGPVLTASGGLDDLWPSYKYTAALHERLELYPNVVDGPEEEGGVPSRLIKTDRRKAEKEGTPWRMFAGSPSGRTTRSRSRSTTSRARVRVG